MQLWMGKNVARSWGLVIITLLLNLSFPHPGCACGESRDDLFGVSFPDRQNGWACGRWGTVLHTMDGGETWQRQDAGTDYTLSAISFADPRHGWAVGDGGTIRHTRDGGRTWIGQESPVPYFLMDVHFVSPRKGWIVTERTCILYTEDGGNTWRIQFQDMDFILKSISFSDERHGWAVGEYGFVYHTADGGKTWKRQAGEFYFSDETGEIVGGNFLFGVAAVDDRTAWVAGIDGHVARTRDGGATWATVAGGVPRTHLFGIAATGHRDVFIGGNAAMLSRVGPGRGFQAAVATPPVTYGYIYGLATKGPDAVVAVGGGGWIYLLDTNTAHWRRVAGG